MSYLFEIQLIIKQILYNKIFHFRLTQEDFQNLYTQLV